MSLKSKSAIETLADKIKRLDAELAVAKEQARQETENKLKALPAQVGLASIDELIAALTPFATSKPASVARASKSAKKSKGGGKKWGPKSPGKVRTLRAGGKSDDEIVKTLQADGYTVLTTEELKAKVAGVK